MDTDVMQIVVAGSRVGIVGAKAVFAQMKGEGRPADGSTAAELVAAIRKRNYVPDRAKSEYAAALLREYKRFLGEDVNDDEQTLTIRILGPGCPCCRDLFQNIMAALTALGIAADVEHVRDVNEIVKAGGMATPALLIDGQVRASGNVLSVDAITKMFEDRVR